MFPTELKLEGPPQRENSWIEWEFLEGEAGLTLYSDGAGNSQGAGYGFCQILYLNNLSSCMQGRSFPFVACKGWVH